MLVDLQTDVLSKSYCWAGTTITVEARRPKGGSARVHAIKFSNGLTLDHPSVPAAGDLESAADEGARFALMLIAG